MSLSQLLFDRLSTTESNKETKLLLLLDDDGTSSCIKDPDATESLTQKCSTLTIYNNNKTNTRYSDSEISVDNNSNDNDHDYSLQDYYDSSVLIGSKPYIATNRNTNNDVHSNGIHYYDSITQKAKSNNKYENNNNNNSNSNNNPCAELETNNDNNKNGNFISASTSAPPDSNCPSWK